MSLPAKSEQSISHTNNLKQFMRKHPLFSFFFMAYTFSWIIPNTLYFISMEYPAKRWILSNFLR